MIHRFFSSAVVSGIIFIEFLVSSVTQQFADRRHRFPQSSLILYLHFWCIN